MDTLYKSFRTKYSYKKDTIVLFSTHHVLGLLQIASADGLFVKEKKDEGFIEHFKFLHAYFAESAIQNPKTNFCNKQNSLMFGIKKLKIQYLKSRENNHRYS